MRKAKSPYTKDVYKRNAEIYKLMSNPKRLEILNILRVGPASLTDLTRLVGASKTNISQHLALLRHLNLITILRRTEEVYYRIMNPKIVEPCKILKDLHHIFAE
jgi:ArsR family transcriptional regulator